MSRIRDPRHRCPCCQYRVVVDVVRHVSGCMYIGKRKSLNVVQMC